MQRIIAVWLSAALLVSAMLVFAGCNPCPNIGGCSFITGSNGEFLNPDDPVCFGKDCVVYGNIQKYGTDYNRGNVVNWKDKKIKCKC